MMLYCYDTYCYLLFTVILLRYIPLPLIEHTLPCLFCCTFLRYYVGNSVRFSRVVTCCMIVDDDYVDVLLPMYYRVAPSALLLSPLQPDGIRVTVCSAFVLRYRYCSIVLVVVRYMVTRFCCDCHSVCSPWVTSVVDGGMC